MIQNDRIRITYAIYNTIVYKYNNKIILHKCDIYIYIYIYIYTQNDKSIMQ